jgi:hypothetical protein
VSCPAPGDESANGQHAAERGEDEPGMVGGDHQAEDLHDLSLVAPARPAQRLHASSARGTQPRRRLPGFRVEVERQNPSQCSPRSKAARRTACARAAAGLWRAISGLKPRPRQGFFLALARRRRCRPEAAAAKVVRPLPDSTSHRRTRARVGRGPSRIERALRANRRYEATHACQDLRREGVWSHRSLWPARNAAISSLPRLLGKPGNCQSPSP